MLVRALFLDRVEELGWQTFWEGLGNGRMMDFGMVVRSDTFAKCLAGLVIGGAVAMICARRLGPGIVRATHADNKDG
jgi:hypothetical protein